jgi:hypothetical protein
VNVINKLMFVMGWVHAWINSNPAILFADHLRVLVMLRKGVQDVAAAVPKTNIKAWALLAQALPTGAFAMSMILAMVKGLVLTTTSQKASLVEARTTILAMYLNIALVHLVLVLPMGFTCRVLHVRVFQMAVHVMMMKKILVMAKENVWTSSSPQLSCVAK